MLDNSDKRFNVKFLKKKDCDSVIRKNENESP